MDNNHGLNGIPNQIIAPIPVPAAPPPAALAFLALNNALLAPQQAQMQQARLAVRDSDRGI